MGHLQLDFIVVTLMISQFQINSQMLRSLFFFYHKDSSFSFLILSVLFELEVQHDCRCIVRNETIGNSWQMVVPLLCRCLGLSWCKKLWCFYFSLLPHTMGFDFCLIVSWLFAFLVISEFGRFSH